MICATIRRRRTFPTHRSARRGFVVLSLATLALMAPASPGAPVSAAAAETRGAERRDAWRDPETGVEFVHIPGGEFDMGSTLHDNEQPIHRVRVSAFWLARSELTQAQWQRVMRNRPSSHRGCDDCPVERVSWVDAQKFLEKTGYRLPTEAEWEYAAGGGAAHQRWAGTDSRPELADHAWLRENSQRMTHPVCTKRTNLFGLCDMTGNVYELCGDWFDAGYYRVSPAEDPAGPPSGTMRVARGGSWLLDPEITGVTLRISTLPSARHSYLGFRPALSAVPVEGKEP